MPTTSTTTALFFSSSRNNSQSSLRITDPFAMDSLDSKARIDFERERQRQHRGHDVRRKQSGLSIKSNHSATHAHKRPGAALGQGNWRNSRITTDDMEDFDFAVMDVDEDRFGNKENSRPSSRPVSVSLEDLVIRSGMASTKKLRESVSRSSLSSELHSRSPSSDSDCDSDCSILLSPMLPPSDYDSSTDDDLDDFDLQLDFPSFNDEFSSPEVWAVADAEDGAPQFRVKSQTTSVSITSLSLPSSSPCTTSAFASSSYW